MSWPPPPSVSDAWKVSCGRHTGCSHLVGGKLVSCSERRPDGSPGDPPGFCQACAECLNSFVCRMRESPEYKAAHSS